MSNANKASGEFGTRFAHIQHLRSQGYTEKQIGEFFNIKPNTVTSIECRARARAAKNSQRVQISNIVKADLEREALKRGCGADELATLLLHTIVVDKLFEAVLDQ